MFRAPVAQPRRAASSISQPAQRATMTPAQNASPQPVVSTTGASWAGSVRSPSSSAIRQPSGAALDDHAARAEVAQPPRGGRRVGIARDGERFALVGHEDVDVGEAVGELGARRRRRGRRGSRPSSARPCVAGVAQDLAGAARRRCRAARSGRRGARRRSRRARPTGRRRARTCCWRPGRATPGGCRRGGSAASWPRSARRPCARACDASMPSACSAPTGSRRPGRGRSRRPRRRAAPRRARSTLVPPAVPAGVMRISSRIRLLWPRGSSETGRPRTSTM